METWKQRKLGNLRGYLSEMLSQVDSLFPTRGFIERIRVPRRSCRLCDKDRADINGGSMKYVVCGLLYCALVVMFLAILKGGNDNDDT